MTQLKGSVCKNFRSRILSRRNFSKRWISGAESIRTSNIRDHAQSEQHVHAMSLFNEEIQRRKGVSVSATAPIVVALNTLGDEERARLQKKFDIAFFVLKEKLPFHKYPSICELQARHGVNIGNAYTNEKASQKLCTLYCRGIANDGSDTAQDLLVHVHFIRWLNR